MTTNLGLSVNDVVNVFIAQTPLAAQQRNFGSLLILGDSGVIDVSTRYRLYTSLSAVAADFGSNAEYQAASIAFGQNPQLAQLYIGSWARTATSGLLVGATLSATQQTLTNFNTINNASFTISLNGSPTNFSGINLTSATNLNGVASLITTALSSNGTVTWVPSISAFQFASTTTGTSASVGFATTYGSGTDISSIMGWRSTQGGYTVAGIAAESPLSCVTTLANLTNNWYGVMFAASVMPADSDYAAVAGLIQGLSVSRIFGVTTQEPAALNSAINTDVASQLQALGYSRTFVQYCSSSAYACAGIFGDAFTVNFNGTNTLYTLKFKTETGVVAETLTESQASALNGKNCNVYVNYNNQVAILQQGTMANGTFFDIIHGTDWLQNDIQTTVFNVLYTAGTKIPQTDAGVNQLVVAITANLEQSVTNGLVAPGVWTGPPVGSIVTGQTLSKGFYIFAPSVASQTQAARAARQSPVLTACIKLAGAIHFVSVVVNVNT
jgi:hypothetical protein